jgi:hypothetical protein
MPLLLAAVVIFFRSIGVLTPIGKFLEYATIAFSVNLDIWLAVHHGIPFLLLPI